MTSNTPVGNGRRLGRGTSVASTSPIQAEGENSAEAPIVSDGADTQTYSGVDRPNPHYEGGPTNLRDSAEASQSPVSRLQREWAALKVFTAWTSFEIGRTLMVIETL